MKPSLRNLFINELTRERVVPIISASVEVALRGVGPYEASSLSPFGSADWSGGFPSAHTAV